MEEKNDACIWKEIKNAVFKKYENKCCVCGTQEKLNVHHKDCSGNPPHHKGSNNRLSNLMLVCRSCHTKEHWRMAKEKGFNNIYEHTN